MTYTSSWRAKVPPTLNDYMISNCKGSGDHSWVRHQLDVVNIPGILHHTAHWHGTGIEQCHTQGIWTCKININSMYIREAQISCRVLEMQCSYIPIGGITAFPVPIYLIISNAKKVLGKTDNKAVLQYKIRLEMRFYISLFFPLPKHVWNSFFFIFFNILS